MAYDYEISYYTGTSIPDVLKNHNRAFYEDLQSALEEHYGDSLTDENMGKIYDFMDKLSALLEKINEAEEQFINTLNKLKNKERLSRIGSAFVDDMALYFACNHMLYKAVEEFKKGETFDCIDNINNLINDENNINAFDDFAKVYVERFKKTEEYKYIINYKRPVIENFKFLEKISSVDYLFDDNEPLHDFLDTDDEAVLEELREKKKKMLLAEQQAAEEAERKEAEEERLKREKEIAEEDAKALEEEKLDETEAEPEQIEDLEQNTARVNLLIERNIRKIHSDSRKHPELKFYFDKLEECVKTISKSLPKENQLTASKTNFRDAFRQFIAVNQILQRAITLKENGYEDKYKEFAGLREDEKRELIFNLARRIETGGLAGKLTGSSDVSVNLDNLRRLLRFKNTKELVVSEGGDLETRILLEGKNAAGVDFKKLLDENIKQMPNPSQAGARYERLFAITRAEMELLKNEPVMDKNGNVSKDVIHKLAKIIACTQILMNDQKNRDFLDTAGGLDDIGFEKKINILAENLEKSDYVRTMLSGGTVLQHSKNLLSMLKNASVLASRLNEAAYAKTVFTGKEPEKTESSLDAIERTVLKDRLERIRYEEEKAVELAKKNGDIYSIGEASYVRSKNELAKMAESLSALTLCPGGLSSWSAIGGPGDDEEVRSAALSIIEGLNEAAKLLRENAEKLNNFNHENNGNHMIDEVFIKEIREKLENLVTQCADLMQYDFTDDNPLFNNLYSTVINTCSRIDEISDGSLFVPDREYAEEENLNAKFIDAENPYLHDLREGLKKDLFLDELPEVKWVGQKEPLFAHDPCANDIMQGRVGDCYFVSTLAAIADKNPQAIRDMMSYDKNKDTVTVRFYDKNNQPRYVTVENSVPEFEYEYKGVKKTRPGYSKGARWVQIMEKAFQQSELVRSINDGESTAFAMQSLLGPQMEGLSLDDINDTQVIRVETPKLRSMGNVTYAQSDLDIFDKMKKWYEDGKVIGCGTMNDAKMNKIWGYIDDYGLPNNHAYTLLGLSESGGKKYVHIRNPHGGEGLSPNSETNIYDLKTDALGESKIELNEFLNHFDIITAGGINGTPLQKNNDAMVEKEYTLYSETIKEMDFYLQGGGKIRQGDEPVPPQFEELRKQSMLALKTINDPLVSPNKLHSVLTDYFNSAHEYIKYRDETPQSPQQEKTPYSAFCYFVANVITKLDERFIENQINGLDNAQLFGVEDLKAEAMQISGNDSPAKKASVEKMVEINNLKKQSELDKKDIVKENNPKIGDVSTRKAAKTSSKSHI